MPSSAEDVRASTRVEVTISRGLVLAIEARDIVTLFLDGVIQLPLLQALHRVLANEQYLNQESAAAIEQLSQEEMTETVDTLRRFACAVVVEPVLVMEPDGHPDHADVRALQLKDLMEIWRVGRAVIGLKEVEAAVADRFRAGSGPAARAAVPPRHDVRSAAEHVVPAPGA